MCGRYFIQIEEDEFMDIMREVQRKVDAAKILAMKTGEIFPTNIVPVITQEGPTLMKWGFKRFDGKGQIVNARSETLLEKPTFRKPLMEGQRCLVPATHYFEWQKALDGKKVKHAIYNPESPVIYMQGLFRMEKESDLPVFVILTREAASNLIAIHDRMPMIARQESALGWLKGDSVEGNEPLLDYKLA